jgi:hypothetical protein
MENIIEVGIDTNTNITIKKNGNPINISSINDIKSIFTDKGQTIGSYNNAKTQMIKEQQILNYLDSIKDGVNIETINTLQMYPLAFNETNIPRSIKNSLDILHKYESNIINSSKHYITNIAWTKINKRQNLDKPLQIKNIFRDSGMGADIFIADGFKLYGTIATYIDPAPRSESHIVWPPKNETITFTKDFMELFGFIDSTLTSTTLSQERSGTVAKDRFKYSLTTYGQLFSNNGTDVDENLNYFSGNTNKNKLLKRSNTLTDQKKALISLKEWGDKMQVLILYVWSHMNQGQTYTMITFDKVVYTLCILLKLKCIFTGQIEKDNIKKYTIEIYEPSNDPRQDAINRYNKKKNDIQTENQSFLEMIQLLIRNPSQTIYIDGIDEPFTFDKLFYEKIYTDILTIQHALKEKQPLNKNTHLNEMQIELEAQQLAEDYLLINFIKKIKNRIKITRNIKYTNTNKSKPSFNNSTKSFFEIALTLQTNKNKKRGGAIEKRSSTLKMIPLSVSKSAKHEINISGEIKLIDTKPFKESDFYRKPIWYDYYVNIPIEKETNAENQFIDYIRKEERVDLNGLLWFQVSKIAESKNLSQFIDSIYSMVLYNAYFNNGIPLDYLEHSAVKSDLENIIDQIITEDLELKDIETHDSSNKMDIDYVSPNSLDVPSIVSTNTSKMITVNTGGKKRKIIKYTTKKYNKTQKKSKTRKIRKVKKGKFKI